MKKKSILAIIVTLLFSFCAAACASANFSAYTDFTGVATDEKQLVLDEGMSIDGVIDETVWADCQNTMSVVSPYSTDTSPLSMSVYTYLGENAVYFGFDVIDSNIFYNPGRRQSRNTGIEVYLTSMENFSLSPGCVSVRATPTGVNGEAEVNYYRPNSMRTEWTTAKRNKLFLAGSVVDGQINEPNASTGYSMEIAVSYEMIGLETKPETVQFTASFVQTLDYDGMRLTNTFLSGTGHTNVASWKAVSNTGVIADKISYLDSLVVVDESMTVDGALDEAVWIAAKENGKKMTSVVTGVEYGIYTVMTDLGVYIGLESNDNYVYYNPTRAVKYNTGAEVLIAANGTDYLNSENVIQYRYNVGGSGDRYRANPLAAYPYTGAYYPAKTGGKVLGGEMNTDSAEGWTGEIFVAWTTLGVTNPALRNQIAIFTAFYRCTSYDVAVDGTDEWRYLSPASSAVFGNSSHDVNPQESFFLFTAQDGYVPNGVRVRDIYLNKNSLPPSAESFDPVAVEPYYYDAIVNSNFTSTLPSIEGGSLDMDAEGIVYDGLSMTIPAALADYLTTERTVTYTSAEGYVAQFNISYDPDYALDGVLDDNVYEGTNPLTTNCANGDGSAQSEFKVVLHEKYLYLGITVTDPKVVSEGRGSGVEMYFNFGSALSSTNTFQIRLYASGEARFFNYLDVANDGFSWKEISASAINVATALTSGGYVLEARVPYSLFGLESAPESCGVAPGTRFYYTGGSGDTAALRLDSMTVRNDTGRIIENYLNFDRNGFAPTTVYSTPVSVIKGMTSADNYLASTTISYLPSGALSITDADFGENAQYVTSEGGEYTFTLPTSIVEAAGFTGIEFAVGNLDSSVAFSVLTPDPSAFDLSKVSAYLNFDDGLKNNIGNDTVAMGRGEAEFENSDGYAINKAYTANMYKRSAQIATTLGTDSFTFSALINGDDVLAYPSGTYAFIVFGTGNVDGTTGFTVRVRGGDKAFQVKFGSTSNWIRDTSLFDDLGGWQRWTFVFDRSTAGTIVMSMYLDAKLIVSNSYPYAASLDAAGFGKLGIGGYGSVADSGYGTKNDVNIRYDDVLLYKGVMTAADIYNYIAYSRNYDLAAAYRADNIEFDFADVTDTGYTHDFAVTRYLGDGTSKKLNGTEVSFGDEIKEYITYSEVSGDFTFALSAEQVSTFVSLESTMTSEGISRAFSITYTPLTALYLSTTEIILSNNMRTALSTYTFTVSVYADSAKTVPVTDVIFSSSFGTPVSNDDGVYTFTVLAAQIEALESPVRIEAERGDATPASFTVTYKFLDENALADIAGNTLAFLDFEDNVTNYADGNSGAVEKGDEIIYEAHGDGKALHVNTKNNTVGLSGITMGTESFTISMDVKLDAESFANSNAAYEILSSGDAVDSGPSSFQISARGNNNALRIQVGRNDASAAIGFNFGTALLKVGEWQRYTLTVERRVEYDATHTTTHNNYNSEGNYSSGANGTYATPEKVRVTLYLDGVFSNSIEYWFSENQSIGNGTLYFGGYKAWSYGGRDNFDSAIDNFMFVRGALTADEISLLDGYYTEIKNSIAWEANNVLITYEEANSGSSSEPLVRSVITPLTSDITFSSVSFSGHEDITGASFTENAGGGYDISLPKSSIPSLANGVTITATVNGVSRSFQVRYMPLDSLYLDKNEFTFESTDSESGFYNFTVKIYGDQDSLLPIEGVTFGEWNDYVTTTTAGEYVFALPITAVETAATHTITATKLVESGTPVTANITVNWSEFGATQIALGAEAFLNFDGTMTDYAADKTVTVSNSGYTEKGDAAEYSTDRAYAVNPYARQATIALDPLGTDSFAFTMDVNGDNIGEMYTSISSSGGVSGRAYPLFATANVDASTGFSVAVRRDCLRVKVGNTARFINHTYGDLAGWHNWTVVFDRNGTALTVTWYVDGVATGAVASFTLADDYVLDGAQSTVGLGWGEGSTSTHYKDLDLLIDNFAFYRGALASNRYRALDSYVETMKERTSLSVTDVLFDYETEGIANGYTQEIVVTKFYPVATSLTSLVTFAVSDPTLDINSYITSDRGGYTLAIPFEDLTKFSATSGVDVSYTYDGITKTFNIKYINFTALYLNDISVSEIEKDASGAINRTLRVSADEDGISGIDSIDFGALNEFITSGQNKGDYLLSIPYDTLKTISEFRISSGAINADIAVTCRDALILDDNAYLLNNYDEDSYKVYDASVGTDSFVVATTLELFTLPVVDQTFDLFGSSGPDAATGFMVSIKINSANQQMRFRLGGTTYWYTHDFKQYVGRKIKLALVFDRDTTTDSTIVSLYIDGTRIVEATYAVASTVSLDYSYSTITQSRIVLGGLNTQMDSSNAGYVDVPTDRRSLAYAAHGFYIEKSATYSDIAFDRTTSTIDTTAVNDVFTDAFDFDGATGIENGVAASSTVATLTNPRTDSEILAETTTSTSYNGGNALAVNVRTGKGLNLSGVNALDGDFTISMWVNNLAVMGENYNGGGMILFTTGGPDATANSFTVSVKSKNLRIAWGNGTASSNNQSIQPSVYDYYGSEWTNFTITVSRGSLDTDVATVTVYINFTKYGSSFSASGLTKTISICDADKNIYFGRAMASLYSASNNFSGGYNGEWYMDGIRIAPTALTDAQIKLLAAYYVKA